VPVSIDTSKAAVAREAVAAGAEIINDVTGLERDPNMVELARSTAAGVCVMHAQGSPQNMQDNPTYEDVVEDIFAYLRRRRDALVERGIERERICLDPGIGFGKTHQHNLTLMARCDRYHDLNCPVLIGHSRKAFLGKILGDKSVDRTLATVGAALTLARAGIQVIRVHDVAPVRQALLAFAATGGIDGQPAMLD
jgi:dihydropteroate synthase